MKAYWVKYISKGPKFEKRFTDLVQSVSTVKNEDRELKKRKIEFKNGDDDFWVQKAYSTIET